MVSQSTRPRAYFMALSQQLLVLGAVGAALIPAAAVLNLDVVAQTPTSQSGSTYIGAPALSTKTSPSQAPQASVVPLGTVNVTGRDVALTSATSPAPAANSAAASVGKASARTSARTVVSAITPVTGYGIVGLSWAHGETLSKADIAAQIRTQTDGVWTGWEALDYADNGPDATGPDAEHGRPGTEEALVGKVNFVQARLTVAAGALPTDLKLTVVNTGIAAKTAVEAPAIDTARLDPNSTTPDAMVPAAPQSSSQGAIAPAAASYELAAGAVTAKPYIYSRAQWGADESWRDPTSLHYFEIHGGFIHHTVNSNDYTAADVPAIIRGIYYFHTHSRGWSDIGYNFLIDKFGRIWEGRYGGVDRAVVGAHAYGVNDYAFGVAAIGNYNEVQPSQALLKSEGALFAWKLSLSGISASAKSANIAGVVFNSPIQGHRDAAKVNSMNQTECPGTYLYAKIPAIRAIAAADQAGWAARNLQTSIVGKYPSIVARRTSDSQIMVLPTGGLSDFSAPVKVANLPSGQTAVPSPDLTGDGKADLIEVGASSYTIFTGNGAGGFTAQPTHSSTAFAGLTNLTAVGDVSGDGKNDLIGINAAGHAVLFRGNGASGLAKSTLSLVLGHPSFLVGAGALTADGKPDLLTIDSSGVMTRFHGNGASGFAAGVRVPGTYTGGSGWSGIGDFTGDGKADIVERSTSGTGYVWPGTGTGGFAHWVGPYGGTNQLGTMTGAAVISGHTYPDLIGTHDGGVWMAANNGRTDLNAAIGTGIFLPNANALLNVGDWDGDGYGDFMARLSNGQMYLYRGKGNGQFYPAKLMTSGAGTWKNIAAPGDITGDGRPDLQFQSGSSLMIAPGMGATVGFSKAYVSHAAINGTQIAAGLWDADGAPDSIFRSGNTLTLWLGDGPGGLYASKSLAFNAAPYDWIAGEAPGRGGTHPDLFAREISTGALVQRTGTNLAQYRYMGGGLNSYNLLG